MNMGYTAPKNPQQISRYRIRERGGATEPQKVDVAPSERHSQCLTKPAGMQSEVKLPKSVLIFVCNNCINKLMD